MKKTKAFESVLSAPRRLREFHAGRVGPRGEKNVPLAQAENDQIEKDSVGIFKQRGEVFMELN